MKHATCITAINSYVVSLLITPCRALNVCVNLCVAVGANVTESSVTHQDNEQTSRAVDDVVQLDDLKQARAKRDGLDRPSSADEMRRNMSSRKGSDSVTHNRQEEGCIAVYSVN